MLKHQKPLHYLQQKRSIKYLHIISNRSEASNISTLSPTDAKASKTSTLSPTEAKHQIPLHYLQQKRSIKYLYIFSKRCEASNISTISPTNAKASNTSTLSSLYLFTYKPESLPIPQKNPSPPYTLAPKPPSHFYQ